jgi:hypothetical protein
MIFAKGADVNAKTSHGFDGVTDGIRPLHVAIWGATRTWSSFSRGMGCGKEAGRFIVRSGNSPRRRKRKIL